MSSPFLPQAKEPCLPIIASELLQSNKRRPVQWWTCNPMPRPTQVRLRPRKCVFPPLVGVVLCVFIPLWARRCVFTTLVESRNRPYGCRKHALSGLGTEKSAGLRLHRCHKHTLLGDGGGYVRDRAPTGGINTHFGEGFEQPVWKLCFHPTDRGGFVCIYHTRKWKMCCYDTRRDPKPRLRVG